MVCSKHRYKIKFVGSRKLKDYAGMNYYAAKKFNFPLTKSNLILIDKNLSKKDKNKTIKHEIAEAELMKRGHSYWFSHKKALKIENK